MKSLSIKKTFSLIAICFSLLITGCASTPQIYTNFEKEVDFNQYKSFSFYNLIEDKKQPYTTLVDKEIQKAITNELEARGLTKAEEGDLKISFNVYTKEKVQTNTAPAMYGSAFNYRGRYGYTYGMHYTSETWITQYTEGTLNIDLVDRVQKQLIWEGAAVGRLKDQMPEDVDKVIDELVNSILAEYPIQPLSSNLIEGANNAN